MPNEKVKVSVDINQIQGNAQRQAEDAATIITLCDGIRDLHEANKALADKVRELTQKVADLSPVPKEPE